MARSALPPVAIVALGLAASRDAAASPLEPLWHVDIACDGAQLTEWHDQLAWIDHGKLQRVDRTTGKLGRPVTLAKLPQHTGAAIGWADHGSVVAFVGDTAVIHTGNGFAVVDALTGKARWSADQPNSDGGIPILHVAGGDVIWVHPAHLGHGDPPVFVERLALATGDRVWRADLATSSGQAEWVGSDDQRLYVITEPNLTGPTIVLTAIAIATGVRLWTIELPTGAVGQGTMPPPSLHLAIAGGSVVYAPSHEGVRIIDGATGKQTAHSAHVDVSERPSLSGVIADADRAYVVTGANDDDERITAIELAHGTVSWTSPPGRSGIVAVHAGALYAVSGDTVRVLDPASGQDQATYGVGGSDSVYVASTARAPALVGCARGKQLFALDPAGAVQAPVRAIVTGRLQCRACGRAPIRVHLGDADAETDRNGSFKLEVTARGTLTLQFDLPELGPPVGWTGATRQLVTFGKRHNYDLGTLRVAKDCGPLESC